MIKKFLAPQRMLNLITYLENLIEKANNLTSSTATQAPPPATGLSYPVSALASPEVYTLLLTCLTKLNEIDKILTFTQLDKLLPSPKEYDMPSSNNYNNGISVSAKLIYGKSTFNSFHQMLIISIINT